MSRDNATVSLDDASKALLYEGANLSQLGLLFKCDHRVLVEKMHGIQPIGKRGKAAIYDISEVAGRMGKLTEEQVDTALRRMNHADLPKALTKEFWAGQRSKQEYLLKAGDLWPTAKVIEHVGEMVKGLKMDLDLLGDAVERTQQFTEAQRKILEEMVDGAKNNMLRRLKEQFTEPEPEAVIPAAPETQDEDYDPYPL